MLKSQGVKVVFINIKGLNEMKMMKLGVRT